MSVPPDTFNILTVTLPWSCMVGDLGNQNVILCSKLLYKAVIGTKQFSCLDHRTLIMIHHFLLLLKCSFAFQDYIFGNSSSVLCLFIVLVLWHRYMNTCNHQSKIHAIRAGFPFSLSGSAACRIAKVYNALPHCI